MKRRSVYLLFFLFCTTLSFAQKKLVGLTRGEAGRIIEYDVAADVLTSTVSTGNALPWYNDLIKGETGLLYGMTESGGNDNKGTIFSYNPVTHTRANLFDFTGANGASPFGSLLEVDGILYGMTERGGANDFGTIFSFDLSGSKHEVLHHFNGANGRSPYGSLVEATNGKLYGVTESGGISDYGTIFSFEPGGEGFKLLHEFKMISGLESIKDEDKLFGRSPYGSLVQVGNELYGVAQFGGTYDQSKISNGVYKDIKSYGVLFSISLAGKYQWRADFRWENGAWPNSTLIDVGGTLYGTAESGGMHNYGVIFSFKPSEDTIVKIADFTETNGRSPYGKLLKASDGKLYGMTFRGGMQDRGVLYQFDPASSAIIKKVDFTGANGMNPAGSLVEIDVSEPIVLPLTLLSFTAAENGQAVQLKWEVEQEFDIEKYEIERSTDGINYTTIGHVAAINSQSLHQYTYMDRQPAGGTNYYRLKIHERFKAAHYSATKMVNRGKLNFEAMVQPNPVTSNAKLQLNLPARSKVQVRLFNTQGVLVMQWPATSFDKGRHDMLLPLNTVPDGTYLLMIETGKDKQTLQLVKINGH